MKPNKFQIKKEHTYKQLLEKGYYVLLEKGFSKTNIEDIVQAAGYTRGAFYFHFESKEDFMLHVLQYHENKRGNDWAELPYKFHPETTSLREVLHMSMSSLLTNLYGKTLSGWLLVVIDFFQSTKNDPSIKPKLKELHKMWEEDVAKHITALQNQGYIASSINPEEAALEFIMTTYGFMVTYYLYDKKDLDFLIHSYVKILS